MKNKNFDHNKEKLIEFYRLFFKQHYGMKISTNKHNPHKIVEEYENEKHRLNDKCPLADRYTQDETNYLLDNDFISNNVFDGKRYNYYQPIKRSLTQRLLCNLIDTDFPINIDRYLNINPEFGTALTFPICSNIMLFQAMEEETFVGYFAVSHEGTLAVIIRDKIENVSQVVLTSDHEVYGLIFKLYNKKKRGDFINGKTTETHIEKTITHEEFNTVFKVKSGGTSLSEYIHDLIDEEEIMDYHDVTGYSSESASSHIIDFIINKNIYTIDVYTDTYLDIEKLKIWNMLNDIICTIIYPEKDLRECSFEHKLLYKVIHERKNNLKFRKPLEIKCNINFNDISLNTITNCRILKIINHALRPRRPTINTINERIRTTNILKLDNGNSYIFDGNSMVSCYGPDKEMEEFDGIINDDYAFQLLEWRYVGQTTIIEPTPQ